MTMLAVAALTLLVSYLVGAVPFGVLIARTRGVDILREGSGNIGATNVGRVLGRRFGILVFVLDFAKGALPALVAKHLESFDDMPSLLGAQGLPVLAGLAAFLGHLFPVYLRFRGGKGVATAAGVVTVLLPLPALAALATWVVFLLASRYVSLASLAAAAMLCMIRVWSTPEPFAATNLTLTLFCFTAALFIFVRHHANIRRLLQGTESQVKDSHAMQTLTKTIHVLALGLWFGGSAFFNLVATPLIFSHFKQLATDPSATERATLPLVPDFDADKATRLAGAAVAPIFPYFFLWQGICGFVVVGTAFGWSEPGRKVHKWRTIVAILALLTVVASWPLFRKVHDLGLDRFNPSPSIAESAKAAFASWHLVSLALSLTTLLLVTIVMALAAQLPPNTAESGTKT